MYLVLIFGILRIPPLVLNVCLNRPNLAERKRGYRKRLWAISPSRGKKQRTHCSIRRRKGNCTELSRVFPSLFSNLPALFLPISPSFPSPLFLCLFTSPSYFSRSLSIAPSTGRSAFEKRRIGAWSVSLLSLIRL